MVQLASSDDIVRFFSRLKYNTNVRVKQTPSNLNIASDDVIRQIKKIELIADQDGLLQVYLFELKTVTVALTQTISRSLRNLPPNILMVLTSDDYERIDFVLLEKLLPKETKRGIGSKQIGVIPRVLSIGRRNPKKMDLRILRRLAYTEEDGWAQYEKLVSAFSVIGWTTDYYTNRALFSDYVLNNRLRGLSEWHDNPTIIFRELTKICYDAGINYSEKPDQSCYLDNYVTPILNQLGYHFKHKDLDSAEEDEWPDYLLYLSDEKDKAIAGFCAFPWNRMLDAMDITKDPQRGDIIPGQYVVRLLERHELSWIIVTNGKIWRLYSKKAHSKATEFYEVDLEEILAMEDPQEAFRYFWLLFRADAFRPKPYAIAGESKQICLLDRLFLESETYAKELGDKLKDNIFKNVFPRFAKGFIATMGGTGKYLTLSEEQREEELDTVYRGTLTFLYRMLFLLYAESRDLLPVREYRGYWEVSLQKMKEEIKEKAGPIRDEVETNLKKGYNAADTILYDRLTELFSIIDKGSPKLNVPTYNGGLFFTDPPINDASLEAANARFLKDKKIPDRFLAEGIDLMAREFDDKTTSLEFIDYKSLGVRQLGSIYEGLLEFKVRIADENLAVVKGKKTEEYKPLKEVKKAKEIIKKGEIYLENDKHERKASGSYFTPDYIVKFIVESTVGPVLAEKMEKLKPKLRTRDINPSIVDELFEIKVLDPAMGSGHFLVETVDFITDKMVDYLSRFPKNPVQIEINRTREEILSEMNRHNISVDPSRLNDLNLLRRHVLKRCIYGVDLNPMAVELAKVSLWLHCFTLGAPLSFLDHHLKCGNSLIGANVDMVSKEVEGGQMTLFSTSRFGGVNKATDMMLKIGELSDVTLEQVKQSKESYQKALAAIDPYKRMMDVYTSRWFGNEPIKTVGKNKKPVDMALAFLKSDESEKWLKDPGNLDTLIPEYAKVAAVAMTASQNPRWRFFHWELEFPEVWYSMGKRKENPGFDAMVGNPPYVRVRELRDNNDVALDYYSSTFEVAKHVYDVYMLFMERSFTIVRENGLVCFIVPIQTLHQPNSLTIRKVALNNGTFTIIVDLPDIAIFEDAIVKNCILVFIRSSNFPRPDTSFYKFSKNNKIPTLSGNVKFKDIVIETGYSLKPEIYGFNRMILEKIDRQSLPLKNICYVTFGLRSCAPGKGKGGKERLIHTNPQKKSAKPYLEGREIKRYEEDWNERYIDYFPDEMYSPRKPELFETEKIISQTMLSGDKLIATYDEKKMFVEQSLLCCIPHGILTSKPLDYCPPNLKFLLSLLNSQLIGFYYSNRIIDESLGGGLIHATPGSQEKIPIRIIHFTTNPINRTQLIDNLKNHYDENAESAILMMVDDLLPKDMNGNFLSFQDGPGWMYDLNTKRWKGKCPEKSDVIHDFLSFLSEQMIDMNRRKRAEQTRFFRWLESKLSITAKGDIGGLAALSGKTTIWGYLGDYQKGEDEKAFDEIADVLYKNKRLIEANLTDPGFINSLKTEYEKSLAVLRPIKEKLRSTDWLIDQIVYKLYGLTEEEIAIVEGRAEG